MGEGVIVAPLDFFRLRSLPKSFGIASRGVGDGEMHRGILVKGAEGRCRWCCCKKPGRVEAISYASSFPLAMFHVSSTPHCKMFFSSLYLMSFSIYLFPLLSLVISNPMCQASRRSSWGSNRSPYTASCRLGAEEMGPRYSPSHHLVSLGRKTVIDHIGSNSVFAGN